MIVNVASEISENPVVLQASFHFYLQGLKTINKN